MPSDRWHCSMASLCIETRMTCDAAGFVSYAGNFAGQGSTLSFLFSGMSLFASEYYAASAPAYETWPGSYMSMGDPKVFNDSEVFLQAPFEGLLLGSASASIANLRLGNSLGNANPKELNCSP